MLSLRDKLKAAAAPAKPVPAKKAPEDCMIQEVFTPLDQFSLPRQISGESLQLMQGPAFPDCRREDICFLDTETTGLSHGAGTVAFLVGIGFFDEKGFTVRQYLMRDYDEEALLLSHVAEDMQKSRLLCTFNGATFDLPLLETHHAAHAGYASPPSPCGPAAHLPPGVEAAAEKMQFNQPGGSGAGPKARG